MDQDRALAPHGSTLDARAAGLYLMQRLINGLVNHMADRLSVTLAALADPTRRAILARLATGEATVNQLAEPFDISLPAVSRHLKVLQKAGLIAQGREAQWRPCRITPAPLAEVSDFVEAYRDLWERRLDRLESYLSKLQENKKPASRRRRST